MKRALLIGLVAVTVAACQKTDSDSIALVNVSASSGLAEITQLQATVTLSSLNAPATENFPPTNTGAVMTFPTSFSLTMPRSRQGMLTVAITAVNASGIPVAVGQDSKPIEVGKQIVLSILLEAPGTSPEPDAGTTPDAIISDAFSRDIGAGGSTTSTGGVGGTGGVTAAGGVVDAGVAGTGGMTPAGGSAGTSASGGKSNLAGTTAIGGTTSAGGTVTSGGTTGSGGTSGAPPDAGALCGAGCTSTQMIDDFEDGDIAACPRAGWTGSWWFTTDGTATLIAPPAGSDNASLQAALAPARGASCRGLHMQGPAFTSWGAMLELSFDKPRAVDLRAFSGLSFWLRGSGSVRVGLSTLDTVATAYGGTCVASTTVTCGRDFGTLMAIPAAWKNIQIPFSSLSGGPVGKALAGSDLAKAVTLDFQIQIGASFDLWLDDVAFLP